MVSTSKKLSVIIPVYNEEGTVTALLDKVVQAVISTSLEIIIVNDGSTDGSPALIEKWVQEHRKSRAEILYLTKKNGGKGSAVKTGIKASTGDVVIIQDADLEYDPGIMKSASARYWTESAESSTVHARRRTGTGSILLRHSTSGGFC